MIYTHDIQTPLGSVLLASDGKSLTGLWFEGQKFFANGLSDRAYQKNLPVFDSTALWLSEYFSGKIPTFTPPLAPSGSDFRRAVWSALLKVPYGATTTYGEISYALRAQGVRASAQAVGGAVAHNPISVIIPCHRVLGADGSLTGYAGGIDKKSALLKLEGAINKAPAK